MQAGGSDLGEGAAAAMLLGVPPAVTSTSDSSARVRKYFSKLYY